MHVNSIIVFTIGMMIKIGDGLGAEEHQIVGVGSIKICSPLRSNQPVNATVAPAVRPSPQTHRMDFDHADDGDHPNSSDEESEDAGLKSNDARLGGRRQPKAIPEAFY